ncbi:hypothetical protein, partial [Allomesorhizobium alhagi]
SKPDLATPRSCAGVAGNLHLSANLARFIDNADGGLFHRDIKARIMLQAALPFRCLWLLQNMTTFTIAAKRSTFLLPSTTVQG